MKIKPYTAAPVLAILVYLLSFCANMIIPSIDADGNTYLLIFGAIQLATYVIALFIYALLFGGIKIKRMRFCMPAAVSVPTQILLMLTLLIGSMLISMLSMRLGFSGNSESIVGRGTSDLLAVLIAAVLPAICEEIVFRGVIMSSLEPCGTLHAVLGTSLLFAFAHMSLEEFPIYFFSSLVLCFVTYVSRSIFASIIIHSVYNAAVLLLGNYISSIALHLESFSLLFIIMLFVLWILITVSLTEASRVYGIYAERGYDSGYTPDMLPPAKRFKAMASVYFSLPFLLAVVIYFAVIFVSM